jgi:hypothetical protein
MAEFNKGDVSEGILAAAITARFRSKTKTISVSDVTNIIKQLKKAKSGTKGATTITEFSSPNANPRVNDTVICKVNLANVNMEAFLRQSTYRDREVAALVSAAAHFANGRYVKEWADMLYNNNQKNTIEVNSEGLLDQTGTKVDLKIVVDGKQAGVGVSLKAADVKQFGQVGGSKWESIENLFNPLGVKFSGKTQEEYTDLLAEKKLAPALTLAYTEAHKQLSKLDQTKLRKNIADFAKHHATLGEENVVLVQLTGGASSVYDFSLLEKRLKGTDISVDLSSGVTDKLQGYKGSPRIPKLVFTIKLKGKDEPLLQIRLKLEGNRTSSKGEKLPLVVRNYIEKGKAITQLIAD